MWAARLHSTRVDGNVYPGDCLGVRCGQFPSLAPVTLLAALGPRLFLVSAGRMPLWCGEWEHIRVDFCEQTFQSFHFSPRRHCLLLRTPREGSHGNCLHCRFLWGLPVPPTIHRSHSQDLLSAWHSSKYILDIYSCNLHNRLMGEIQLAPLHRWGN